MLKIILILNMASIAFAGVVNLDFRFESDSSSYNNAAKAAGSTAGTNYLMKVGRLDFLGKLNEEVTYRLRFRFDKPASTILHKTDNFSSQVDYAFIQNKLAEGLSLTLGKFASEIGGVEGNTTSADIYLPSQGYQQIMSNEFLYVSGAKLSVNYGFHEASIFVFNQSESTTAEQTKASYGLVYKGSFKDKTIMPVLGFLNDEKQSLSGVGSKISTTAISAGTKWDPKPYFLSFDYLVLTEKNVTSIGVNDSWSSLVLEAGYDFEGTIPKLKYETTDKKTDSATTVREKTDGITVGVEYRPYGQESFRYHLMVTQLNIKADGSDSRYEQHFLIGTRIYADFFK